ncbi:MAG: ATP-binding protein [Caldilinea sp.]|nr:ATP-binding protein [Caldilineaceae bacterium]MCW5844431.1 ATP-binding protein [Caldilinea sp.]
MMRTIFELTDPRDEVLSGELSEDLFAARLKDVIDGNADPVYQDATRFFANTYPTAGLRTLLREVLGRLTGSQPANNPIIRLETSFGGGKTHNLIALYHALRGALPRSALTAYLEPDWVVPAPGDVDIVGVVGSDLDPANGVYHETDDIRTYTLWGELAYQLGGRKGYLKHAEKSDVERAAPGTGLFEQIIGDRPTLIMIDEIARHLRAAAAVETASRQSDLASQTVAFLMSLMEYAASQTRVVLVLTLAGQDDAFSAETATLRETLRVSARQERVLTPSAENEISAIVVHRLFKRVDHDAVQQIVDRYGAYYQEVRAQNAPIHDRALRADYLQEVATAYPFHPELIRVLNLKVATIPNFQRTRGALRLLAAAVRRLWRHPDSNTWLIHPHHIDLGQQQIVEDLTSRLDRAKFKQVCEADIVSPQLGIPAHAAEVDEPLVAGGKLPYARRLGTTIFLHSLTHGIASGVEAPELMLATLTPAEFGGDDPAIVQRSLERLYARAWFLEFDGFRYRFKTEPSLNKIVEDETGSISVTGAKSEIDTRIRTIWRAGYLKPQFFPVMPNDLDDDAGKPKLAIIHYDALKIGAAATEPPELVQRLAQHAGIAESFRTYANNVLFLVADSDQVEQMVNEARRYLALERITTSAERMREFADDQQKKLREMRQAAELNVRVAITKTYRYLFYPSADGPKDAAFLRRETVPPQGQGDTNPDQVNVIVRLLHNLEKVRTSDDNPLPAAYVKGKAWDRNQVDMSTEDLRKAFARKVGLPLLLDVNQLQRTIENGVKTRQWIYYNTRDEWAYDEDSPPTFWEIGDHTRLYAPSEAERLQLRIKGKWQPPAPTPGGDGAGSTTPDDEPPEDLLIAVIGAGRPTQMTGTGVPAQAFQQVLDHCGEHDVAAVRRLTLSFQGISRSHADSLAAIGLAIPQLGKAQFGITLTLNIQFDAPPGNQRFELTFQGEWDRYKRLKAVTDAFVREEAHSLHVDFRLVVEFGRDVPLDDPQLVTARDVLVQMGIGPITLAADPVYATASNRP